MTMHLFGTIITPQAVASNNRGEVEGGTLSTLQKVIRNGDLYSTVSSEAIRYAVRECWANQAETVCRNVTKSPNEAWDKKGKEFKDPEKYIDNDVLGYMHAKEETATRRGILEISRAVSTTPWPGTISKQFASPGSGPDGNEDPRPYQCEIHDTRYQYTFAMTPDSLLKDKKARTEKTLLALQNLRRAAGNHARFLFDFAPEAVVLRWTTDPAPRMMFCFEQDETGKIKLDKLIARVAGKDIDPTELVVGTPEPIDGLDALKEHGVAVHPGVKAAFADILARIEEGIK